MNCHGENLCLKLQGRLHCCASSREYRPQALKMATTPTPRRLLIFNIQKRLLALSSSQLQTVASAVDDDRDTEDLAALSEPELFDLIVDYLRSEKLKGMEDEGMSQILPLNDMIEDLLRAPDGRDAVGGADRGDAVVEGVAAAASLPIEDTVPRQQTSSSTATMDSNLLSPPRDNNAPTRNIVTTSPARSITNSAGGVPPGRASPSPSIGEQVVRITDVAALLPRREFKLYGGQISDTGADMSYSSLCKQMDEGLQEGFSDSEVIRTVLKITKPGTFRDMLTNKEDLTMSELKRFLRSHIRDKNSTELFQELSTARQQDKESPQQFLYRIMGLKQRVVFESQQPGAGFCYDRKLVQGTFLHTLYQGLNEKNNHVRCDLKPFLTDLQVSDDLLLEQITKSTSEEADRLKRLGAVTKHRPVTVSAAQTDKTDQTDKTEHTDQTKKTDQTKQTNVDSELQANRAAILELTAQVTSLTKHFAQVVKPTEPVTPISQYPPSSRLSTRPQTSSETRGRCQDCVQKNIKSCPHCFVCGQEGHRAVGCLQRKASGNGRRSLE